MLKFFKNNTYYDIDLDKYEETLAEELERNEELYIEERLNGMVTGSIPKAKEEPWKSQTKNC